MPSIWRAPAGTIPSAEAVQAREHPCGQSLPSSLTRPLSHAASLAERFRTLLPLIPDVATATMAQPQVRSASLQSQAPQSKQQQLRVSLATFASFTILPCASTTHTLESSK